MKPEEQILLKFESYKISNVVFETTRDFDKDQNRVIDISLNTEFEYLDDKTFLVLLILKVNSTTNTVNISAKAEAKFSTSHIIDDAFKNHPLMKVNAPAIVFPYLRAFISTLTVNAGFVTPIILPTFNFMAAITPPPSPPPVGA